MNAAPIFILGLMPRTGTNYLFDLLCLHPDCRPSEPIWEDYLLHQADRLERYAAAVLGFLGLDPHRYDFRAAANLPVRGSSSVGRGVGEGVHWRPVTRPPDFSAVERWAHWSRARHERFNWIAGGQLECLGYEPRRYRGWSGLWRLWNHLLDLARWARARLARTGPEWGESVTRGLSSLSAILVA